MSASAIAVTGIGCRYPGAPGPRAFWENVLTRRQQFRRFPDRRLPLADYHDPAPRAPDKTYATRGAFIDGFEFDWVARRIPQKTFEATDVVHWLALEVALQALEDAGYTPESVPTERSAALVGNSLTGEQTRSRYMRLRWPFVRRALQAAALAKGLSPELAAELEQTMEAYYKSVFPEVNEDTLAGALSNTIAGRICNFLDFQGGGYTVDGACASGMLAVATASAALANGDIDFALAGGVDISLDAMELIGFAKVGALTRDDMNVYDKRGSGFIPGEGCGFVALKRLDDAREAGDYVYAVLRGWGISTDGKGGITAPRADSQAKMLLRAYERAGYSPHQIAFVEGHGTATAAGDKAELEGIQLALSAYGEPAPRSVGMTSFKSLIGHTKAASGIAGLIKTVIAVNRRVIPPFAGFREPNAVFAQTARALYPIVRGEIRDRGETLRAGASAMGFGGINCHFTLESADAPAESLAPSLDEATLLGSYQDSELFLLGAASVDALRERVRAVAEDARGASVAELTDLSAKLAGELEPSPQVRAAVVAAKPDELVERLGLLEALLGDGKPAPGEVVANDRAGFVAGNGVAAERVGFLFPGQGSQQLEMGRELVDRFDWARELVAAADARLREDGGDPVSPFFLRPTERAESSAERERWAGELAQTEVAQPAICLVSLLWLRRLASLGIRPSAVAGHSLGELTAFHAAGAFDEETLIRLAALRGRAMAASGDEAGTMASLACDRARAEELVAGVDGYAVVANVNSPAQTVVSGERSAVEAVTRLAEAAGIAFRPLAVSNAFHSRLVERAAEEVRERAPVPERMNEGPIAVVSGVDGKTVEPGLELREHFARQIVSQVDFVSTLRELAGRCELLVEVGPGRVLSGLAAATLGDDGPRCVPVAQEPARSTSFNLALAHLFARGHDLDARALFAGRLVRPFVAASELRFVENPLEQPLAVDGLPEAPVSAAPVPAGWLEAAGLPAETLAEYLARRGRFLAEVIRADLADGAPARPPPVAEPARRLEPARARGGDVEARLVQLAAEHTGFPAESIPLEARLLDDLNLDSIKAAELVVATADEFGVAEALDSSLLANAMLRDVADAIRAALAGGGPDAETMLLELAARHTGFPLESLTLELRLLDDLNLDSIKAAELVLEAADAVGAREDELDPSQFANATLGEVAGVLRAAATGAAPAGARTTADPFGDRASWVRTFVVEDVEEPLAASASDLSGAAVLVVHDEDAFAAAVARAFAERGARTEARAIADAGDAEAFTHVVALLPRGVDVIDHLHRVATLWPADAGERTLVYVQRSGDPAAAAFAASVHHERPELRVRVVELERDDAEAIVAEASTAEAFSFARYRDATRWTRRPRVQEPALEYEPRAKPLGPDDVVLVTGGAKGITAECALSLARSSGARMALVGSSPEPDDANDEIARTLARFGDAGLTARYYRCDVADATAVRELVTRVRDELGPIAALVHGAGINVARRIEQAPPDAARAEIAPKVVGARNLLASLADAPPRLVVGLSSITAVTGMPGNAWYGFANEALEHELRAFAAEHDGTSALAVAFSIWGEVGMGARTGSAEHLARMGIGAIAPAEGVRRFLEVVENDPGSDSVVIAARLRGLDTWRPDRPERPAADRFLEDVVQHEPGVEVVARAKLELERDAYLADHVYKGSHLFPTVFGLEAMAQAAAYAAGRTVLWPVRVEHVRLERPIVVDPAAGATVEVRAEVLERESPDAPLRVRTEIGAGESLATASFSAAFVLGEAAPVDEQPIDVPREPLDLRPEEDLYSRLLFQGPSFRRLVEVYRLDSSACVFAAEQRPEPYLLGDPFFRDTLLQAAQLVVPQSLCLPVEIGAIEIASADVAEPRRRVCVVYNEGARDGNENARVVAFDEHGRPSERLTGYKARILERREDNPTAEELASPDLRDAALLRSALTARAHALGVRVPQAALAYMPDLHGLSREERHDRELPLFAEAVARYLADGGASR